MLCLTIRTCIYPTTTVALLYVLLAAVTSGTCMLTRMVTLSHCSRLCCSTVESENVSNGFLGWLSLHMDLMLVVEIVLLLLLRLLLVWIHWIVRSLLFLLLSELILISTSISIIIMPVMIILYV